jgi:hypothetical protein
MVMIYFLSILLGIRKSVLSPMVPKQVVASTKELAFTGVTHPTTGQGFII